MNDLKSIRTAKHLTQKEAASLIGVSLRSYISYESDPEKEESLKYRFLLQELERINPIDEEHGVLPITDIKKIVSSILSEYDVEYCYLFGSYAKGKATGTSDVDLLISTKITDLKFYGLVEQLREGLHKKIDLLDVRQLTTNSELLNEVLRDGVKIYG